MAKLDEKIATNVGTPGFEVFGLAINSGVGARAVLVWS